MNGLNRATELYEKFTGQGESAIDQFVAEQISEELFVDYKRVTNDGASPRLEQPDRENLARALSGFGNSEGGIVIWGVDCRNDPLRGDVPTTKYPIQNAKRFLSYLEGATSGGIIPPHDGVRHHLIERAGTEEGFVATFIPKSMYAPHQCIVGRYKGRYYIRAGSNFEQAPHGLLASMFGKRPSPYIFHMWQVGGGLSPASSDVVVASTLPTSTPYVLFKLVIRNHGVTVAKDLYVNYVASLPGPNCTLFPSNIRGWQSSESMRDWRHIIAPEGYRLPPAAMVKPLVLKLFLRPPFQQGFSFEISFGCEGSPVHRLQKTGSVGQVVDAYEAFMATDHGRQAGHIFGRAVYGVADESTEDTEGLD